MDFNFVPSEYQKTIFNFVENGSGNAVINAKAGSAKTTTAVKCLDFIPKNKKVAFFAFNRSIVQEIIRKIGNNPNIDICTFHSLAHKILVENWGYSFKLNEFKYKSYLSSHVKALSDEVYPSLAKVDREPYLRNINYLIDLVRFNLCETIEDIEDVVEKYGITLIANEIDVVEKLFVWGKENINEVDYTDLVWLIHEYGIKTKKYKYDFIFIDEAQDTSPMQHDMVKKCFKRNTRFLALGDYYQCQPAGTKISLANGQTKNIEDVVVGDKVITYNQSCSGYYPYYKEGSKYGFEVTKVSERYVDKTIRITTENGLTSEYSYNHICYAKFNRELCAGKYALYLMCNEDDMWRIGKTQLYKNNNGEKGVSSGFGLSIRTRYESCEKAYILSVYDTNKEATLMEGLISAKFGIPQVVFNTERACTNKFSNKEIKEYYFKYLGDIKSRVIECLNYFKKDINCPFVEKNSAIKHSRDHMFEIYACNLFPEIMSVNYLDKSKLECKIKGGREYRFYRYSYTPIIKIDYLFEHKKVYSIEVEKYHNYLADGILTHNCINAWAGADKDAFKNLLNEPNTIELPLPISYRCPKSVIRHAQRLVPDIEAAPNAPEGSVVFDVSQYRATPGDMILCRTTAPLVKLQTEFLSKNIGCYIKGSEIGKSLIHMVEGTGFENLSVECDREGVMSTLTKNYLKILAKLMDNIDLADAVETDVFLKYYDSVRAIEILSTGLFNTTQLKDRINTVFKDKSENDICLSTVHKAKGLEANNVFILCPSLIPSRRATLDWEIEAERNLEYVAITRAKKNLYYIDEKLFSPRKGYSDAATIVQDVMNAAIMIEPIYGKNYLTGAIQKRAEKTDTGDTKTTRTKRKIGANIHKNFLK